MNVMRLRSYFVALIVTSAAGVGVGCDVEESEEATLAEFEDEAEDAVEPRYLAGDCVITYRSPGTLITVSAGSTYSSPGVPVNAGSRMVARLHRRSFSGGTADIRIQRWNGLGWVNYLSSSGSGARKLVDTTANTAGQYRIQIYTNSAVGVPSRAIFDVVPATCTGLDTCFGASGKNCEGFPNGSCSEQNDGQYLCDITVGANMHDSCCSANPNGSNCGGNGSAICPAPVGSTYKNPYTCCQAEWDHAVGDAAAFRLHKFLMDPVKTGYRRTTLATTVVAGGKVTAKPLPASGANPGAIKAPAGTKLWLPDAQQGWCVSGSFTSNGNDATCK
jgi:hypothetical protein